jgi:hypothetical protein
LPGDLRPELGVGDIVERDVEPVHARWGDAARGDRRKLA